MNINIKLVSKQIALFSPGIVITNKLKVASAINDILPGLFDSDPVMIPLPEDAPPDIPRIQMSSRDKKYSLSIALNRIDFIFQYKEKNSGEAPDHDFFKKILTIFKYFTEDIHAQFTRSGLVTNWVLELETVSAAEFLLNKYIQKDTPIGKPHELELHCLTKESIGEFSINKWVRIKSTRKKTEPEKNNLILVLIDINTIKEKIYNFDMDLLEKFLEQSNEMAKETFKKHLQKMGE